MEVTAFSLGQRFVGLREISGPVSNAHILAMLRLDNTWVADDSVPWCSAWVNYLAWLLRLPRSKSLAARSWLKVGIPIALESARPAFDVVVLKRGGKTEPGPDVFDAPGHVGFFAGLEGRAAGFHDSDPRRVLVLGGNQSDEVSIAPFPVERLLGVRRLLVEAES
jgi:uncharacterized protein (TIGR02594 family)